MYYKCNTKCNTNVIRPKSFSKIEFALKVFKHIPYISYLNSNNARRYVSLEFDFQELLSKLYKKIASPQKIFGYLWILCWIAAIWMYHLQFFIMGLFSLFLSLVIFDNSTKKTKTTVPLILTMNKTSKTLTVQKLYDENFTWDEHEICSGQALLPSGQIKKGDVIKNCEGNIALRHIPSNTIIGAFNFQ